MNKLDNPFTPGAGFLPPELAGREQVIEDGRVVAARAKLRKAERGLMLIGSRGVGKTSLLKWLAEDARQAGVIPVIAEIQNDSQGIEELSAKMKDALHALDYVSKVKTGVRESFAVLGNFIRKFAVNIGPVGVEIETCAGLGESGNIESDLSAVLLTAARAAKAAGTAIGLYVDELQNMRLATLSGIIVSLHHAAQELLPLYLIGSGLPTVRGLVARSKTYAERMFNYEEIGALDESASADAIRKPMRAMNVCIEDKALSAIFKMSGGYPFFLQECGYQVWQAIEKPLVTVKDVRAVADVILGRLDRNFFAVRLDRISELERVFLRVMADVPGPEAKPLAAIARGMGRSANSLSMLRQSLIRKGVLFSAEVGTVSYTVPMFGTYMKRIFPKK